ncbi:hypothetical protein MKX01_006628 [Papaver californicum]|nr:hypothetical protein MKX01_006628 [Papaver californicum]
MKFLPSFSLSLPTLLALIFVLLVSPFTVILSDSGIPSALIDAPQTGFSMDKNSVHTDPHEQQAVYDIMRATGNGWATDIPDICRGRWHGIYTLSYPLLLQNFLTLKHSSFTVCFSYNPQPIPSFLGHLGSSLQTLVLRENGHVGLIPTELGNLTHLKVLDLHNNNLDGSIPVSLGQLQNLKSLDLSRNRLSGSIPALSYPILNILDMSQNLLADLIPMSIGDCPSLIKLDLSRNRLIISPLQFPSGCIPRSISGLTSLLLMDLSYNQLSGPLLVALGKLNSLQALILKGNRLESTIIPSVGFNRLQELTTLVLSDMALQGSIPKWVGELPKLRVIHLDRNHLNGLIPKNFQCLKVLSELRLNANQLVGRVPFRKETVWKMSGKLRLYNNSGLCYDASFVPEEDTGSFVAGVGYCEPS